MKKIAFLLLMIIVCAGNVIAQVKDEHVEEMMTKRVLNCDDIYYNAITMIPKLYREGKTDTLQAVLNYWQKNCGLTEPSVVFSILYAIEKGTFYEELNNIYQLPDGLNKEAQRAYYEKNILSYLTDNASFYNRQYYSARYKHFYFVACVEYSNFIRSMASSISDKPNLSPVERFLVAYYTEPSVRKLRDLSDSVYAGTLIQRAYLGEQRFGGTEVSMQMGYWMPQGKLSVIGNHFTWGSTLGGCTSNFLYSFSYDFRFGNAPNYYYVVNNDSLQKTHDHIGYYLGLNFGWVVLRSKTHEVSLLGSMAYDGIEVIANTSTSNSTDNSKTLSSFNLNTGIGYKVFLTHRRTENSIRHSFFSLQAKYNFLNYANHGGTDLTGNSISINLGYGAYIKHIHHYYDK